MNGQGGMTERDARQRQCAASLLAVIPSICAQTLCFGPVLTGSYS
jgi:hypothetical protein